MNLPVLIVNDDPALRELLVSLVAESGKKAHAAANAKDALDLADRYDFSLAFVDLHLPDMTGDEFYGKLLEKEAHHTLPLVTFIDGLDADEVKALNAIAAKGQITLLSKPPKAEWIRNLLS